MIGEVRYHPDGIDRHCARIFAVLDGLLLILFAARLPFQAHLDRPVGALAIADELQAVLNDLLLSRSARCGDRRLCVRLRCRRKDDSRS